MKKLAIALGYLLAVCSAYAAPIKGLVDVATGKEIPDADLRYMRVGITNSYGAFTNLYVLVTASNGVQAVNWYALTNYVGSHSSLLPSNLVYSGSFTNSGTTFSNLYVLISGTGTYDVVNWYALTNYVGSHSSLLPSNLVFSTSNTFYAAGTTQSMPYLSVSNGFWLFGVAITNVDTNLVLYADGSQPLTADWNVGGFGMTNLGTLLPYGSNIVDLGSAVLPWRSGYFASPIQVSGINGSGNITLTNTGIALGSTDITKAKVYINGESGAYTNKPLMWLNRSSLATGPILKWGINGSTNGYIDVNGNILFTQNTTQYCQNVIISNSFLPGTSNTIDLGSATMPFRHGYFGDTSLFLGDYNITKAKAQSWDVGGSAMLDTVCQRGSNTTQNVGLNGRWNDFSYTQNGGVNVWENPSYPNKVGAVSFGVNDGGFRTNGASAGINAGYVSANAVQYTRFGWTAQMNWGFLTTGRHQTFGSNSGMGWNVGTGEQYTDADCAFNFGSNSTNTHDYSVVFGNGTISYETNSVSAGKYYTTRGIMPTTSNTVDIGSATMPFRHGYFGDTSLYLGDYQVTKTKQQNYDTSYSWGNHAIAGYLKAVAGSITITNGAGQTSFVARAVSGAVDDKITAAGIGAGSAINASAYGVTLYGWGAGAHITSGGGNTAIGGYALEEATSQSENTAVGWAALYANNTGKANTAIGFNALTENQGQDNTAVGRCAGGSEGTASTFSYSAMFGYEAGRYLTSGSNSTFIGYQAGNKATTGKYNTLLGSGAGHELTVGEGNVFLGYQAGYNETKSNKLYIANNNTSTPLIYGDFSAGYLNIGGHIYPWSSNAYDLGSAIMPWRDIYLGTSSVYMAGIKMLSYSNNQLVAGAPLIDSSGFTYGTGDLKRVIADALYASNAVVAKLVGGNAFTGNQLIVTPNDDTGGLTIQNKLGLTYYGQLRVNWYTLDRYPALIMGWGKAPEGTWYEGTFWYCTNQFHFSQTVTAPTFVENNTNLVDKYVSLNGSQTITGQKTFSQTILPSVSNSVDLGSVTIPFRHGYFGETSLYVGDYNITKVKAQAWDAGSVSTPVVVTTNSNFNAVTSQVTWVTESSGSVTGFLPTVSSSDIGMWFRFVKLGTGTLVVDAAGSDIIIDSGAGDTVYDKKAAETWANITLMLVKSNKWVATGAHGTWTTTTH